MYKSNACFFSISPLQIKSIIWLHPSWTWTSNFTYMSRTFWVEPNNLSSAVDLLAYKCFCAKIVSAKSYYRRSLEIWLFPILPWVGNTFILLNEVWIRSNKTDPLKYDWCFKMTVYEQKGLSNRRLAQSGFDLDADWIVLSFSHLDHS